MYWIAFIRPNLIFSSSLEIWDIISGGDYLITTSYPINTIDIVASSTNNIERNIIPRFRCCLLNITSFFLIIDVKFWAVCCK